MEEQEQQAQVETQEQQVEITPEMAKALGIPEDAAPAQEENSRKYLGRYESVDQLEEHARHFQSSYDKAKGELDQLKSNDAYKMVEAISMDPDKMAKVNAILNNEKPPPEKPALFDPHESLDPETESGQWFQHQLAQQAKQAVQPELERMRQQAQALQLVNSHPDLMEAGKQREFTEFVARKQQMNLDDYHRLWVAEQGGVGNAGTGQRMTGNEAIDQMPTGSGGSPSRQASLTPEQTEALRILGVGVNKSDF